MARTKISEFSATPANNTDIDSINIAEGCAPSGINDAIRELMAQLKDFQTGAVGDSFNGPVGTSTAAAGAFTTLSSTGNTTLGDASGDAVTINGTATFANANPTLTAGTANGVTYLNGSKVLTSGSALTYDGTTLKNAPTSSGVTPSANAYGLFLDSSGNGGLTIATGASAIGNIYFADTGDQSEGFIQYAHTGRTMAFGAAGSTQMTLTSTGLGIGTSSPAYKLDVKGNIRSGLASTTTGEIAFFSASNDSQMGLLNNATEFKIYSTYASTAGYKPINFYTSDALKMTLDADGDLGIGTSSPTQKLDVYGNGMKVNNASYVGYLGAGNTFAGGAASDFCVRSDNVLSFATNGPYERARITSGGRLFLGTSTSISDGLQVISFVGSANSGLVVSESANTSGAGYIYFGQGASIIGSISRISNTAAIVYNTTSDYRLKTVTGTVTGQGSRIDALKPVDYLWTDGGQQARGFLAHEFQTVYPNSVTGEKDALDADGNPKYQSMQAATSEVIADLIAEIQSLRVRVAQLETN